MILLYFLDRRRFILWASTCTIENSDNRQSWRLSANSSHRTPAAVYNQCRGGWSIVLFKVLLRRERQSSENNGGRSCVKNLCYFNVGPYAVNSLLDGMSLLRLVGWRFATSQRSNQKLSVLLQLRNSVSRLWSSLLCILHSFTTAGPRSLRQHWQPQAWKLNKPSFMYDHGHRLTYWHVFKNNSNQIPDVLPHGICKHHWLRNFKEITDSNF